MRNSTAGASPRLWGKKCVWEKIENRGEKCKRKIGEKKKNGKNGEAGRIASGLARTPRCSDFVLCVSVGLSDLYQDKHTPKDQGWFWAVFREENRSFGDSLVKSEFLGQIWDRILKIRMLCSIVKNKCFRKIRNNWENGNIKFAFAMF